MLKQLSVKNFTAFPKAELEFASGLNVILGENSTGKSHLLKLAYLILSVSAEEGKKSKSTVPTKSLLATRLAAKLINVIKPESLGRLVRRKQGKKPAEIFLTFNDTLFDTAFSFATQSKSEVSIQKIPSTWQDKSPVFLPTRELLSIYPGFVSVYENHYLEFEENIRDTCLLLGAPLLKGSKEKVVKKLLLPLEEAMGGSVILKNGRFYLKRVDTGYMEMPLLAEGLRKIAMVAILISTGSLLEKGWLFWDEPETNLNPKLIRLVASTILHLCNNGIQVFVATHSLFFARELEILSANKPFKNVKQRYFALEQTAVAVNVHQGNLIEEVDPLVLLDEELQQSDRFMAGVDEYNELRR
jgi:predicted ATPase